MRRLNLEIQAEGARARCVVLRHAACSTPTSLLPIEMQAGRGNTPTGNAAFSAAFHLRPYSSMNNEIRIYLWRTGMEWQVVVTRRDGERQNKRNQCGGGSQRSACWHGVRFMGSKAAFARS